MSDLRIAAPFPAALRPLLQVARLRFPQMPELLARWYQAEGAVIPGAFREPTEDELERIWAPADDPHAIRLVRVPGAIVTEAVERYDRQTDEWLTVPLGGTVTGTMAITVSFADEQSTTVHQLTQEKVGMHVDAWSERTHYLGINLGPGDRYLCVAPDAGLTALARTLRHARGDEQRARRRAEIRRYVREHGGAGGMICYVVRLGAPAARGGELQFEAYANVRVDRILHDGSTLGSPCYSRVALIKTLKLPVDVFPPLLA
jgi:hypothetical protein